MAALQFNLLGDLVLVRDGCVLPLPPSKKTRALLAYLALHPRSFSREHLCDLLWEVPDDPRGALRWSLSKLRRLVDDAERPRILADRLTVRFDAADVDIDVVALRALVEQGVEQASTPALEAMATRFRGDFIEGLDLPRLHDFHVWCLGEREQAARGQAVVLGALVERLATDPERAVPYARAAVRLSPYDEAVRARLIRLLVASNRSEEAEKQYGLGVRMLKEARVAPSGVLYRAWRGSSGPRTAPMPHVRGQGESAPTSPVTPEEYGLVGRNEELERLNAAFSGTRVQHRAGLVLLTGEPGIGKSRMLETVVDLAREAEAFLLVASALESDTIRPFALWIDAFRRLGEGRARNPFGHADYDNRDRLFAALTDRLAEEAAVRPVVLVFDDMQWCDESSAAALEYVARMNSDRPLFGVLAARDVEVRANGAVESALRGLRHKGLLEPLQLGPLSDASLRELIAAHAPEADGELLARQSGGNPMFAIELARAEAAGGSGASLDELVGERLARFDREDAEVLRWAAVLDPRIDPATMVRVTGLDHGRIEHIFEAAERARILRTTERGLRFSHDLVAQAVRTAIPPAHRRAMHRRVAEILEQDTTLDLELAADLASHALQSGDPRLAGHAMVAAGRLCLRFFANEEALKLARQGMALAGQLPDAQRVCLTLELHDVMLCAAPLENWEAVAGELVALAERALEHGALAHARLGYQMVSNIRWAHGQVAGAHEEALQAERVTRNAGDREQIIAMAETAKCLAMLERDLDRAEAMVGEAQALAARQRMSHQAIPMALGLLRFHDNRFDEAEAHFREARTLCKAAGDRICEYLADKYLVMIDLERGQYASALKRCASLLEIGMKLRDGSEVPFARAVEGLCRYAIDDDPEPLAAALDDLRDADAKFRLAYILIRAARLDLERGRLDGALARAREGLACAQALERATEQLLAHHVIAEACRASGDRAAWRRHAAAVAELEHSAVAVWARIRVAGLPSGEVARGS